MKTKIFVIILAIFMIACTNTKNKEKISSSKNVKRSIENKKRVFKKDIENLSLKIKENKICFNFELSDDSDVKKIQLLEMQMDRENRYHSLKFYPKNTRTIEIDQTPLLATKYQIKLISNDGSRSIGIESEKIFLKHPDIVAEKFMDRDLYIYLPEDYENSNKIYPVLYMLDGQNLFIDNLGSSYEWKMDEIAKRLKKEGKIDDLIIVGISSSYSKRGEEYIAFKTESPDFKPEGYIHAEFIVKKIIPHIEDEYRVSRDREKRAIMGSSYGGLMAMTMIDKYPEVFSFAGVVAPWVPENGFKQFKSTAKADVRIWVDSGSQDLSDIIIDARQLTDLLIEEGYEYGRELVFYEVKDSTHNELDWAERAEHPLVMFLGKHSDKITNYKIETYKITDENNKDYSIINLVVDIENGNKYSLYREAKYEVLNKLDGSVDEAGVISFETGEALNIKVRHNDFEEIITVKKEDFK